jgi:hypothetical protein
MDYVNPTAWFFFFHFALSFLKNVISKTSNMGTSALENYIGLTIKQQPMDIEDETKPSSMQLDSLPAITFESLKKTIQEK